MTALTTAVAGAELAAPPTPSDVAGGQLLAMFFRLDDYGKRVLLAQVSAMLKVQSGGA